MDIEYERLPELVGTRLGPSEFRMISQQDIVTFADITNDHYWLHVDEAKAAAGPFGTTIAHGYLSLSMISALWPGLLWVADAPLMVNYGFERVRFTAPVLSGTRVRLDATLADVAQTPRGYRLTVELVLEREGEERPAFVATALFDVARPDGSAGHESPNRA